MSTVFILCNDRLLEELLEEVEKPNFRGRLRFYRLVSEALNYFLYCEICMKFDPFCECDTEKLRLVAELVKNLLTPNMDKQ